MLQVFEPHQHVDVRAVSAALGHGVASAVVEHVAAHVGQRLGLPLPGGALVVARERLGLRVDHRGDRVEHRRIVEPALDLPAAARESREV